MDDIFGISATCLLLVCVVLFMLCNFNNKDKLANIREEFVTGMWTDEVNDTYLYIDKDTKKNNYHNGYIVKSDIANEPIKIKIKDDSGRLKLHFKGTTCVKEHNNNVRINVSDGTMIIKDDNNEDIKLKKDN